MNQDDARKEAEKLVDFIIASDRLEGLVTPPEDREMLIKIAVGETPLEEYMDELTEELRERAETIRAMSGTAYEPSNPNNQQPHSRFTFKKDVNHDEEA